MAACLKTTKEISLGSIGGFKFQPIGNYTYNKVILIIGIIT